MSDEIVVLLYGRARLPHEEKEIHFGSSIQLLLTKMLQLIAAGGNFSAAGRAFQARLQQKVQKEEKKERKKIKETETKITEGEGGGGGGCKC